MSRLSALATSWLAASRRHAPRCALTLSLLTATLLAGVTVRHLAAPGTAVRRIAAASALEARAAVHTDRIAVATMGTAYLETSETAPTQTATKDFIDRFDVSFGTGLGALRKEIESVVAFLLLPVLAYLVLYEIATSRGQAPDAIMTKIGIRFFTAITLLWFYPAWDGIMYHRVGKPLADALSNPTTVNNMMKQMVPTMSKADGGGQLHWNQDTYGLSEGDSPIGSVQARDAYVTKCLVEKMQSKASCQELTGANQTLINAEQKAVIGAVTTADQAKDLAESDQSWVDKAKEVMNADIGDAIANALVEFMADSVTGWLMAIQSYLLAAIIWFMLLGTVMIRHISLAFASVAVLWSLMPAGQDKMKKWYQAHAQVCLMPAGFALAGLVIYTMQMSVWLMPTDGTVIGFGVKLACLFMMFTAALKMGSFTKLLSGDIVEGASAIGNAGRDMVVTAAKGALAVGAVAATGGASVALQGAAGMAKAGGAKVMSKSPTLQKAGGVLGRLKDDMRADTDALSTTAGKVKNKLGLSDVSVKNLNLAENAKTAWRAGTKAPNTDAGAILRGTVVDPISTVRKSVKDAAEATQRKKNEGRKARPDGKTLETVDSATAASTLGVDAIAKDRGIDIARPAYETPDMAALRAKAAEVVTAKPESERLEAAFTALVEKFVESNPGGVRARVTEDEKTGRRSMSLDEGTADDLNKFLGSDGMKRHAARIQDEMAKVYGGADKIPAEMFDVDENDKKVLNWRNVLAKHTSATNAVSRGAVMTAAAQEQSAKRAVAAHHLGTLPGSLDETLVRSLGDDILEMSDAEVLDFQTDSNGISKQYADRIRAELGRLKALIAFQMANGQERFKQAGLPVDPAAVDLVTDVSTAKAYGEVAAELFRADETLMPLTNKNGLTEARAKQPEGVKPLLDAMASAVKARDEAIARFQAEYSISNEPDLGLVLETLKASNFDAQKAQIRAQADSPFEQARAKAPGRAQLDVLREVMKDVEATATAAATERYKVATPGVNPATLTGDELVRFKKQVREAVLKAALTAPDSPVA